MVCDDNNYKKIAQIDGLVIFKDNNGYFIFEHYLSTNCYYALKTRLGKTAKEVEESLSDIRDWYYRVWHGERDVILKAENEIKKFIK